MPDKVRFLCSCPGYLNGTTKYSKKKTTCKQCKGIKLPMVPIGGTVRMVTTPYALDVPSNRNGAATVRIPSNVSHNRPSILCGDHDPYDYIRQSRLLYSDRSLPININEPRNYRNNNDINNSIVRTARTYLPKTNRTNDTNLPVMTNGRSILHTTFNPYELISTTLHNNEFAPNGNLYELLSPNHFTVLPVQKYSNGANKINELKPISNRVRNQSTSSQIVTPPIRLSTITQPTITEMPRKSVNATTPNNNTSKYKSILKQPIILSDVRISAPSDVFKELAAKTEKRPLSLPSRIIEIKKKEITDSGLKVIENQVKKELTNSIEAHTSRCKKVQFSESDLDQFENNCDASESIAENDIGQNELDSNSMVASKQDRSRRRKSLHRSLSDRRVPHLKEDINFKDTTALRAKPIRSSPRNLFQKQFTSARPSSPPPQLPSNSITKITPVRPPRQQRKGTVARVNNSASIGGDETKGARIFGLLPVSTINKTSIKIPAFTSNKFDTISNKNDETMNMDADVPYQKTSIAINNDDCFSSINVNGNGKLYHSSVMISNSDPVLSSTHENTVSAEHSNGISVKATNGAATEISIVYHNNSIPNNKPEVSEIISTNANKTKTLICLDYKDQPDHAAHTNSMCFNKNLDDPIKSHGSAKPFADSFILKLLNDPHLGYLLQGLEIKTIANIIEMSLIRLKAIKHDRNSQTHSTKDSTEIDKTIANLLHTIIKEERTKLENPNVIQPTMNFIQNGSSTKKHPIGSRGVRNHYYRNDLKATSLRNNPTSETIPVRELYEMLVDSSFWKNNSGSDSPPQHEHQYESIALNCDPIYEEITEINDRPPPLPVNPPPTNDDLKAKNPKSMFLGASKYDILSYLVDAKERGIVPEETYTFKFLRRGDECTALKRTHEDNGKIITIIRDRSETKSCFGNDDNQLKQFGHSKGMPSIERNDSGVGSETSKTSRNKYQPYPSIIEHKTIPPIHLCEDCDEPIELQMLDETSVMFTPIVCRKCGKKRAERREILAEFFETEEKYSRDLQIIIDEFYQPMLVAGLLTQEQLSAIFLNIEELLENSQSFCEKLREAFYMALEQGDDDLFTVDIGKIILATTSMLCAFENYCIQQAAAGLLLANLEKDKELLRIFLRVSQMENTVLRRMNLNSFLMVPVQRVTKYPLLLARLYKVTPIHLESRERLKDAQEKIECHLNRMNREAKDISTKLWRRLSSYPTLRTTRENDLINIKLRKIAIDLLEWSHDKVHFAVEGKLLITQPTDNNWRKGRTLKLTPVNALLITNEVANIENVSGHVNFPKHSGFKEATLLLVREKSGRYNLYREPLFLDRCVICTESEWAEYFEVHEISSKDSFIFKAEDDTQTKQWYSQLQYHAQGIGAWRKRRTALANIMINGMTLRS